jgi:hypothetical protein
VIRSQHRRTGGRDSDSVGLPAAQTASTGMLRESVPTEHRRPDWLLFTTTAYSRQPPLSRQSIRTNPSGRVFGLSDAPQGPNFFEMTEWCLRISASNELFRKTRLRTLSWLFVGGYGGRFAEGVASLEGRAACAVSTCFTSAQAALSMRSTTSRITWQA